VSVAAREAYRLWAATYDSETAITVLEDEAVRALTPPLEGRALLDAGCGTGRRLPGVGPAGSRLAVGIDLVPEMLRAGRAGAGSRAVAAADVTRLPFAGGTFEVIWCRLVIGHLPDPAPVYGELSRVARAGGAVIVSDFHPDAAAAGHRRTFRDAAGTLHEIEHFRHTIADHRRVAADAGLTPVRCLEAPVGPTVRSYYERAGQLARYDRDRGLRLVLVLRFTREG
jgi:malonyl-CoA O-methyltransferase